jgi:hypothetical protein
MLLETCLSMSPRRPAQPGFEDVARKMSSMRFAGTAGDLYHAGLAFKSEHDRQHGIML